MLPIIRFYLQISWRCAFLIAHIDMCDIHDSFILYTYARKRVRKRRLSGARSRHVKAMPLCSLMHLFITMQLAPLASPFCRTEHDTVSRSRYSVETHSAPANVSARTARSMEDNGVFPITPVSREFPGTRDRQIDCQLREHNGIGRFRKNNFAWKKRIFILIGK